MTASRLVDPGLFTGSEALTLRGTRCAGCGTTTFPAQETCPKCFTQDMRDEPLPRSGSVWSWTVQHFAPKPPFRVQPGGFVPYLLGYVDLGPVVIETRLAGSAEEPPSIGDDVDLVPLTAYVDDDGTEVVTFAFATAGHAGNSGRTTGRFGMSTDIYIVGAGLHEFGRFEGVSGLDMAEIAMRRALLDSGLTWGDIDYAVGGSNVSGKPDTLVGRLGLTGIPFPTVRNGCATGGLALSTAANALRSGEAEAAVVVGFDKHGRGAFSPSPTDYGLGDWYGETGLMTTTQYFALKAQRYLHDHDISATTLARVAVKAFGNAAANPFAWRRKPMTVDEVLNAAPVNPPLTQFMFCSPNEGAAALVLTTEERARDLTETPVKLASVAVRTRRFGSFEVFAPWLSPRDRTSPSVDAAAAAFARAGIAPADVEVAQLQDTESGAEVIHMAETGLCQHGEQEAMLAEGATDVDGRLPVNTDGGCLANGEPIGASGLRQVHEVVRQLQGRAPGLQVPGGPRVGFTHVYGSPGTSACTVLTV